MNKMSVILIPYRDRQSQLDYFIDNTVPILKKYPEISKVVVIEQGNQKLFNRGKLINIGVLEYPQAEYYITQDVDINPKDPVVSKQYCDPINSTDTIRGIYNSVCDTLGGIIKISKDNMFKINGFPNNFWGWGGEDKAIRNRAMFCGLNKEGHFTNTQKTRDDDYFRIFNDVDDRHQDRNYFTKANFEFSIFKNIPKQQQKTHIFKTGLTTLQKNKNNMNEDPGTIGDEDYRITSSEYISNDDFIHKITVDI